MFLPDRKLIIIPTRKCGGTSISNALKTYMPANSFGLYNLGTMSGHHPKQKDPVHGVWADSCLENDIYLIVRNPFDKMVSNYFYSNRGKKIWREELNFDQFVVSVRDKDQPENWEIHTKTLSLDFVRDKNNKIINHTVMHFESLKDDFKNLTEKYNLEATLEHQNKSRNDTGIYRQYYNDTTKKIVKDMFAEDLEYFGYNF